MKKETVITLSVYILFLISGSVYGVGEKTVFLGGEAAWNLVEVRSGLSEAARVRSHPVLVLSAGTAQNPSFPALDMSLSFDEKNAALFADAAGHYRLSASSAVEAADQRWARGGTGAALFSGSTGTLSGSPLVIEPQSRSALFAPNSRIQDFSLEFWLYPLNLENGEQILSWTSSLPQIAQRIQCSAAKNRLNWSFSGFFVSPDTARHININISGDAPVVPKTWSHHLIRFDSASGMLEYLADGRIQAIEYATTSGREGGEVYTPLAGTEGSFILGSRFLGLVDEFKIQGIGKGQPFIQKYLPQGGRMETMAIDLGEGNSGILKIEARGGRTSLSASRGSSEFRENGRFRFTDDSEMQFFIRTTENPYRWDNASWQTFTPGTDLDGSVRGRYVQLAVNFYPSADGEISPYLEEVKIVYLPDEPPLPPAALTAVAMDGGVQLRWKNSPDSDTAGYLIYYGTVRGEYFGEDAVLGVSPIDAGKRNTLFIDGLKNGSLYYFRVAAYDRRDTADFHTGEFSREVSARPLAGLSLRLPE